MQDGSKTRLNLLSTHKRNGVVYYDIEVHVEGQSFLWSERYSQLIDICAGFPTVKFELMQASVKFPPKDSVRSFINNIGLSDGLLCERFALMKLYF
jgi:hypothetical protein